MVFQELDNALYTPDARRLGILNVHYLAAEYPLDAQGLTLVDRFDTTWIYQNEFPRPRAWIEPFNNANANSYSTVDELRLEPNQIFIKCLRSRSAGAFGDRLSRLACLDRR